jgi:hypothetical protein
MKSDEFIFEDFESQNPAEIARPFAESFRMNSEFDHDFHKKITLPYLDKFADDLGLLGKTYFIETNKAYSIPATFEADEEVRFINFGKLSFEGPMDTHSVIQIGKLGGYSVRALCLSFSDALLLPHFDRIPDDHLLHAPVLAIEDATKTN